MKKVFSFTFLLVFSVFLSANMFFSPLVYANYHRNFKNNHLDVFQLHYINSGNCNQILFNSGYYTTCYDYKARGAKYVTYTLFGSLVNSVNIKKRPRFYPDLNIPKKYRSTYSDYTRNIYKMDRGHCYADSSADNSQKKLDSVYVMSNIIPQYYTINRDKDKWAGVERYERYMAVRLGTVRVIDGVIYGNHPRRIGKDHIAVPNAFWKIIYNQHEKFKRCFYFENNREFTIGKHSIKDYLVNCSKIR